MKPVTANVAVHCEPWYPFGAHWEHQWNSYFKHVNLLFISPYQHADHRKTLVSVWLSNTDLFCPACNILPCKCIIGVVLSVGLQGSGWIRLSPCSTAMSTECWDSFLRRPRVVFAPWSIQPARESYPAWLAHRPHLVPPVLRITRPVVEPVIMATSSISVPAGPALPHLWTTIWTWTWISLMLRSLSEKHYFFAETHFIDSDQTKIAQSYPASFQLRCNIFSYAAL